MDPIRNPYAPGAGQRPPELAGRDEQLRAFDVVLERVARAARARPGADRAARGRQDGAAQRAALGRPYAGGWGTGKLEARPDQRLRRPLSRALHQAVRELGHPRRRRRRPRARRDPRRSPSARPAPTPSCATSGTPASTPPRCKGRADSGDIEIDLVELFTDVGGLAADVGKGVAVFIDEMQDLGPDDVSALCAACHEISQSGPAGHRGRRRAAAPAGGAVSASKSYSERLFRYQRIDRLAREAADRALTAPAEDEDAAYTEEALAAMYAATGGYPYFIQAYGKAVWDLAPRSPITADDVAVAAPEAEARARGRLLRHRFERATPGERDYLRAMADAAVDAAGDRTSSTTSVVPTADVAAALGKKPQSLSPGARLAAEEGADLLRRARPDRFHGPALRALPARARLRRAPMAGKTRSGGAGATSMSRHREVSGADRRRTRACP